MKTQHNEINTMESSTIKFKFVTEQNSELTFFDVLMQNNINT